MLALIYLGMAVCLGDLVCRYFYRFVSIPHRWATASLVGIFLSTWFTYLAGWAFAKMDEPLLWANLLFFVVALGAILWLFKKVSSTDTPELRLAAHSRWDWITLGALFVATCLLLTGTLYLTKQGRIRISGLEALSFGQQSTVAQSFGLGHNFPTEYAQGLGQANHYPFLFYFQVGNLEFLGLNLAWSINVLSIVGLISMLTLIVSIGELLFNSRIVGRLGAALFFFHGSPAFIHYLKTHASFPEALGATLNLTSFIASGYPYRGENQGVWTQIVFVNRRHLPFAIGILLVVLIFLIDQYRQRNLAATVSSSDVVSFPDDSSDPEAASPSRQLTNTAAPLAISFIFSGALIGALPLWDLAVFVAATAILSLLLILFPFRWQMLYLGLTTAAVALPQFLSQHAVEIVPPRFSFFHWGYIIDNPTIVRIIGYIAFTFGLKWPLILLALVWLWGFQRRIFITVCSLFLLTFCIQLRGEKLANHTFLNVWLIIANLFAAYGLCWLWRRKTPFLLGPLIAVVFAASIATGGMIDLLPIYNNAYVELSEQKASLMKGFVFRNSVIYRVPESVSPSLAGQDSSKPPVTAFEGGHGSGRGQFDNPRGMATDRAGNIFVADTNNTRIEKFSPNGTFITSIETSDTGHGIGEPSGVAVDSSGNIYVVDASNHRIQKFGPNGTFTSEWEPGLYGPRKIAIGADDSLYVVDQGRNRIVKFNLDGQVFTAWGYAGIGDGQFADPTSVAVDPNNHKVYVADPINSRIQIFDLNGVFQSKWILPEWKEPHGFEDVIVDSLRGRVYASSAHSATILAFDFQGNRTGTLKPEPPDKLDGPSALAITRDKLLVLNMTSARVSVIDLQSK